MEGMEIVAAGMAAAAEDMTEAQKSTYCSMEEVHTTSVVVSIREIPPCGIC